MAPQDCSIPASSRVWIASVRIGTRSAGRRKMQDRDRDGQPRHPRGNVGARAVRDSMADTRILAIVALTM